MNFLPFRMLAVPIYIDVHLMLLQTFVVLKQVRAAPLGDAAVIGFIRRREGILASAIAGDWLQV